jgi:hypothetical protein
MWEVLGMYGVGGRILGAITRMFEEITVCVRIGRKLGWKFKVEVGLLQGRVMSPWLFNIFIDGMVREVNARVLERGEALMGDSGGEWQVNQILYADGTAVLADEECKFQRLVSEFGRVCERRKLSVNVANSKVMRVTRNENVGDTEITLNGIRMEEVYYFRYLGVDIDRDGGMKSLNGMKSLKRRGENIEYARMCVCRIAKDGGGRSILSLSGLPESY